MTCSEEYGLDGYQYSELLDVLNGITFQTAFPLDDNRADDGIELRYKYGWYHHIPQTVIASELDYEPCSVLEMLVALADRCEHALMEDPLKGDRTAVWFWMFIENLDLLFPNGDLTLVYDGGLYIKQTIHKFMSRDYDRNGVGGLFPIPDSNVDMREIDIWLQLHKYMTATGRR